MSKRYRNKPRQSVRMKMRTAIIIAGVSLGFAAAFMLFIFQLFENETSVASTDPMVVSTIDVFQDTLPVFKGTSMQVVLGVRIHTKGRAQELNFSGMELSARGTSRPFEAYAGNARLWTTGRNNFFLPVQQVGVTLEQLPEGNFKITGNQKLTNGDNYFWLTFDVNQVAGSRSQIDAECISVQVGTLTHEPSIAAPAGARRILNNIPYYSTGSGDISSLDSWNSSRDGSGKRPANFNQSTATFHIQPGHILRNDLNACLTYLIIERNGVLISASSIKSEQIEIYGGGSMVQEKVFTNPENTALLKIRNGGNYIHNNKGRLPGFTREFESYSNVVLNNYSESTFTDTIDWGNLHIDTKLAETTDFLNCFHSVRGDLEIRSDGANNMLYTTVDSTINIGGDLIINGARLYLVPKNKMVLNVTKDFIIKEGVLSDNFPGKTSKGGVEFNPGAKIYVKSGLLKMTSKNSGIRFSNEFVTWCQDTSSLLLPDITVMPGCTLRLAGNITGQLPEHRSFVVSSTAMLDCGTTIIKGNGAFRLEQYGILATGHPDGIHSNTDEGSIQTKSRFYSSGASYIFSGSCSPQSTGVFTTMPVANTVNQMIINKSNAAGILILQQDMNVTGRLVKEKGSINKNSHKLESGEQITATIMP